MMGEGRDREERAIAECRAWLADNLTGTLPPPARLAARFQLSVVFVMGEIRAARSRAARPVNQFTVVTTPPDPGTLGEDAFAAYLDAGRVNAEVDTVHALARRFDLSFVYVRHQLAQRRITVPPSRRRSITWSGCFRPHPPV